MDDVSNVLNNIIKNFYIEKRQERNIRKCQ